MAVRAPIQTVVMKQVGQAHPRTGAERERRALISIWLYKQKCTSQSCFRKGSTPVMGPLQVAWLTSQQVSPSVDGGIPGPNADFRLNYFASCLTFFKFMKQTETTLPF